MDFKFPRVRLGDTVFFYPVAARHLTPAVAIVTAVGSDVLGLNVLDPNMHDFRLVDGVRHLDDPRLANAEIRQLGAFELRSEYYDRVEAEAKRRGDQARAQQAAKREPAAAGK